jgi:hypothetical protein
MKVFVLSLAVTALFLSGVGFAPARAITQEMSTSDDIDKIYQRAEVDRPAKLKNEEAVLKGVSKMLYCAGGGSVMFTVVLDKSGKVGKIKTEHTDKCEPTEKGLDLLRTLKFTPAQKANVKVSQYQNFKIEREVQTISN